MIDREEAISYLEGSAKPDLMERARMLRDEGWGRVVTYSPKVFIPLTNLCRDRCSYCTFVKPPGNGGGYLEPDEVMEIAAAGESHRCTEALFTLGDRPEYRWPQARSFLSEHGYRSTIDYTRAMTERVLSETSLFPHANPGVMSLDDLAALRRSNPSVGLMLENISTRLTEPGMPHHGSPDKDPAVRVATIEAAGTLRVPFTTGILVGIGETVTEIVDSLLAIAGLHRRFGHIQEVIVQNFRAKADTRMRSYPEPVPTWFARVVAVARCIFGPEMSIQVPPNLTERFEAYLDAGVNDWGGVSPVTIDFVNPEAPWPHLSELRRRTNAAGFELKPRLCVYPQFIDRNWLDGAVYEKVVAAVDENGYAIAPQTEEMTTG